MVLAAIFDHKTFKWEYCAKFLGLAKHDPNYLSMKAFETIFSGTRSEGGLVEKRNKLRSILPLLSLEELGVFGDAKMKDFVDIPVS